MKIAKVEPIPVAYPEPNDYDATRYLCLVKITTDEGVVGWGESITQFPEANPATAAIITGMAELLIGSDPVNTEALWRQMKDRAWWYGYRGGIASYAISAIDIALWDIKGKILGKSVLELLGGNNYRARLKGGGIVDHQGVPTAGFGGEVCLGDHSPTHVRSKALCLIFQVFHHGVAVHALRVAGKVVHFGGGGQLATGLQAHVHDGFQICAGSVNGGGVAGRSAADDQAFNLFHKAKFLA